MRALAGPAMLLVMVGGFALYRCSSAPEAPSRDFLDLEFAGADDDHTGTCYSLSTVIVANTALTDIVTLETVANGARGPAHVFQRLTFRQEGDQVQLVAVDVSEGQNTRVAANIDALLDAPRARHSTPVDRCREPGATGYLFKRK
jgi:hypothetical protein